MSNANNLGYDLGVQLACASHGITSNNIVKQASFVDACQSSLEYSKLMCKAAAVALELADGGPSQESSEYVALASGEFPINDTTYQSHVSFLPEVFGSQICKQAGFFEFLGKAIGATPEVAKTLAVLSVGTGTAGGALAWALNRDTKNLDAKTQAKKEQAAHYRQIATDIKHQLKLQESENAYRDNINNAVNAQVGEAYTV